VGLAPRSEPVGEAEEVSSYMAFNTSITARWTILSSKVAMPSGAAARLALVCTPYEMGSPGRHRCGPVCAGPQGLPSGPVRRSPTSPCPPLGGLRVDGHIGRPEAGEVDVVQQRCEPYVLVLLCYLTHTVQPA